jgi:hypothetical protein
MLRKHLIVAVTLLLMLVAAIAVAMYRYDTPFPVDAMRLAADATWTIDSATFREDSVTTVAQITDLIRRHNGLPQLTTHNS